jgi:predicted O-methyltransferase YrrM
MFLPLEYIKYRWNAKGRHGIHSPFVYAFVDKCLRQKIDDESRTILSDLFDQMRKNDQTIVIQDFGVGSKKLGNERAISAIFSMSSSKGKYGALLYRLARFYAPKNILEFGTSLGVGTTYLTLGSPDSEIQTVEACENTRNVALGNLSPYSNVESVHSTFTDFLSTVNASQHYDLIFIDGHHDGAALLDYLERLQAHAHDETLFILDDIRWSDSMKSAWERIVKDDRFHLTLDLFRVGIVMKRAHQEKEHFVIRY